LPDGRWVVVLADVTGHGIGPAILSVCLPRLLPSQFQYSRKPENGPKELNLSFAEDLTPERCATFVAVLCHDASDEVELLSAGHGPFFAYSSEANPSPFWKPKRFSGNSP
jgi:serine phosphatase RsbU (regulator of sigma subunit)